MVFSFQSGPNLMSLVFNRGGHARFFQVECKIFFKLNPSASPKDFRINPASLSLPGRRAKPWWRRWTWPACSARSSSAKRAASTMASLDLSLAFLDARRIPVIGFSPDIFFYKKIYKKMTESQ